MQHRTSFQMPEQALAEALFLAPDEDAAQACALLAEEIAADHGPDAQAVELVRAAAMERYELEARESAWPS